MCGLEWLISNHVFQKLSTRRRRANAIQSVIDEQFRQEEDGLKDAYRIASASTKRTRMCRMEAQERATQEALDAFNLKEEGYWSSSMMVSPIRTSPSSNQ
jgi:hypothetical protein